jgi:hypothetical protein
MPAQQQQINYGVEPNDGLGDPLRTAFVKTDDNFDAIWNAGPVGSNVTILNNTISAVNTNGNLVLNPNGVGAIQTNATLLPRFANSYDLGSATLRYRSAYIGYGGLDIAGNVTLSANITTGAIYTDNYYYANGEPFDPGSLDSYGNANVAAFLPVYNGNILANILLASDIAANAFYSDQYLYANGDPIVVNYGNSNVANYLSTFTGDLSANSINVDFIVNEFPVTISTNGGDNWQFAGNILRGSQGDSWTSSADTMYLNSPANGYINLVSFVNGNLATELYMEHGFVRIRVDNGGPEQNWNFLVNGTMEVPGDIVPLANATQSLGNVTNQWANLWVANNTIYIGGVPLGITGNVLTVNGEPVLSNDSNSSITTTGNITANTFVGGNIQVDYVVGNTTDNSGYIQWDGNSSGDNNGYTTLRLVPDDTLVDNDQYLIVDPTDPYHIHIRAGGTQDSSQAELFLGGETNYVRVRDGTGVRLQNQTRDDNVSGYSDPADFNTGTWYESSGTYYVQYTTVDAGLINVSFQFNDDNENTLLVYYNGGANTAKLTSAGSVNNLGGGVYRVSVNEAPPASPTTITELAYTIWTNRTNSARLENNDFTVLVTDDVTITGADGFRLVNESADESIQIITNDNATSRFWDFGSDGNLSLPAGGYISVSGGLIGSGASPAPTISGFSTAEFLGNITGGNIGTTGNVTSGNIITAGSVNVGGNVNLTGAESTDTARIFADVASSTTSLVLEVGDDNADSIVLRHYSFAASNTIDMLTATRASDTAANVSVTGNLSASGNVTGSNLIASTTIYGNVDVVLGNIANASATKTRITSFGANSYIQTGNGTAGSTGNIVFAPYLDATEKVVIDTASGNVTAANFTGNITITGNVTGTSANVDLVAGAYEWSFDNTGNLTLPGNTFAVNYANNTPVDVVTRFEGTWAVPTGNSTQSFTVDPGDTYYMWVEGNIPNGIIAWNATATVTNTNVPVVGAQYAWVYDGAGTPIDFTSIPNQFTGTANTIVRSNVSPSITTNRFDFGINNTSGSPQTVRYGWIRIS